mgnify:FL=1
METLFYILIFIIGALFGSFYTLAIYRIPKKQDITHTHSYCPNCNHKLGLLDLIPIFSYIFLLGKCRYCKEKIRPRYLIIEILSGILFVAIAYLNNFNSETLSILSIIEYAFIILYLTFIILMVGIDRENRKIEKSVTIYGIVISIMYMIYLCIVEEANIYRYVIYLIAYIIILIFDTITLKRYAKSTYLNSILLCIITMTIFTSEYIVFNTIITTLIAIAIYLIIEKVKNRMSKSKKSDKQLARNISIGFYLGVINILLLLIILTYVKFII